MSWDYGILEIAFASQPDATTPLWTNVTSRLDPSVDLVITRGRPTELDDIAPSTLTCALNNADHHLTPGNPYSPWYPNVKPARRIRYRELIDGIMYELFDGYLQFPDIERWAKAAPGTKFDQVMNVSAVDRIARLDRAETFYSTLAEHIQHAGGTDLQVYYPLNEAELRWKDLAGTREPFVPDAPTLGPATAGILQPAAGIGPAGDDIPALDVEPVLTGTAVSRRAWITTTWATPISISSQIFAIAWWMTWDNAHTSTEAILNLQKEPLTANGLAFTFNRLSAGSWEAFASVYDGGTFYSATIVVAAPPQADAPTLVSMRVTLPSGLFEVWVGDGQQSTTLSGSPPSTADVNLLQMGDSYDGSLGHVQVYLGSTYTRDVHLAQYEMGREGLYRQRVDERIATVAGYAGVAEADLELDEASALMSAATLAGQKPAAELRVAATTDSGLLFTSGGGRIVFHARGRRYNPPIAGYVDLSWLSDPWTQRLQPPINVARVSRGVGVEAVSRDRDSVEEFGEYELPGGVDLESATDADPENLARMYTLQYPDPRMRAPSMTIDLMTKSNTIRHAVLGREISDRISMTGLPANAPEGIGEQHIEGIVHRVSSLKRETSWNCSPVLGPLPGVAAVWPQVGVSVVAESTLIPY